MKHAARRRARTLAAAGALALLGSLTACGGGDEGESKAESSEDTAATQDEFCEAFANVFEGLSEAGADEQAQIAALKDAIDELEEVGPPEEMPEDARRGFEVFIEVFGDIDENTTMEELNALGDDVSAEDQEAGTAFTTWATEECMGSMTEEPSDGAS